MQIRIRYVEYKVIPLEFNLACERKNIDFLVQDIAYVISAASSI